MGFKGYDEAYLDHLLHIHAGAAGRIAGIRWEFVSTVKPKVVLDYGSGTNIFSLFRPDEVIVDSFDVGTMDDGAPYPQTGIRHERYDLICLWDVIEHVDWANSTDERMLDAIMRSDNLAAAVPIRPHGVELETWKHYKPGEHLTYFTMLGFIKFIESLGFVLYEHNAVECPPRQDIKSFLFVREGKKWGRPTCEQT